MQLYRVNLTGQATVTRTQRVYADNPREAEEKAVNYASMAGDHEGWVLDPNQHVVDITAAAREA